MTRTVQTDYGDINVCILDSRITIGDLADNEAAVGATVPGAIVLWRDCTVAACAHEASHAADDLDLTGEDRAVFIGRLAAALVECIRG